MLWNDLSDGSIKTFLILGLLAGNIALILPGQHASAPAPGSARVSRAGLRRPAETNFPTDSELLGKFAMARTPSPARETRALPEESPR